MTICKQCGRAAQPGDLYCQSCGHRFDDYAAAYSYVSGGYAAAKMNSLAAATEPLSSEVAPSHATGAPAVTAIRPSLGQLLVHALGTTDQDAVREYILDGQNVTVGRSPSCDIVLEGDQMTSRRHALLRFDGAHYTLIDLGSSNGTFVNDVEIREALTLHEGDRITVGEHELIFSTDPAGPAASLTGAHMHGDLMVSAPPAKTNPHVPAVFPAGYPGTTPAEASATGSDLADSASDAPTDSAIQPASPSSVAQVAPAPSAAEPHDAQPYDVESHNAATPSETRSDEAPETLAALAAELPVTGAPAAPTASEAALAAPVVSAQAIAEVATAGPVTAHDAPTPAEFAAPAGTTTQTGEVESIHTQLAGLTSSTERLAARLVEAQRLAEQRRSELAEARDRIEAIISDLERITIEPEANDKDLSALIQVTRQAAENPHHLDYVAQLAEHAGELLDALEARQARREAPMMLATSLQEVRAWLNRQA